MRYHPIPGTDLSPSVICMGGGPLSVEGSSDKLYALLDNFYALGGTFIDSANIYGKWLPNGENVCDQHIGAWINSRGVRDDVVVTSKGGHPHLDSMTISRLSKDEVAADLDESRQALHCDTIDLYYLHRDDENLPVSMMIDYLNDFVSSGKIRYFGVSNWRIERVE
ncbi:MAG: aldo/keto reductase, partial [Anaerolineae bacterium]|nr:aldo/keto reductase [Anaerolineae bacterium]